MLEERRRIYQRPSESSGVITPSTAAAGGSVITRILSPSIAATTRTYEGMTSMGFRRVGTNIPLSAGIGGTTLRFPTGRSVISPIAGDRTGMIPSSTLATQSVFGGANGGMGTAAAATPTALGPATLTALGSSVSKMGVGVTNTLGTFVPLAIKVILAVIVIKIVLWLIKGRRR